jgi:hypothetical protein
VVTTSAPAAASDAGVNKKREVVAAVLIASAITFGILLGAAGSWRTRLAALVLTALAVLAAAIWVKVSSSAWNIKAGDDVKDVWGVKHLAFLTVMATIAFAVVGTVYPGLKILSLVLMGLGFAALSAARLVLKKTSLGTALVPAVIASVVLGTIGVAPHDVTKVITGVATQTGAKAHSAAKSATTTTTAPAPTIGNSDANAILQIAMSNLHLNNYDGAIVALEALKKNGMVDAVGIDQMLAAAKRHDLPTVEAQLCERARRANGVGLTDDVVCAAYYKAYPKSG